MFHQELLKKEGVIASVKTKAKDLIRHRDHVPGLKEVKRQHRELGQYQQNSQILFDSDIFYGIPNVAYS